MFGRWMNAIRSCCCCCCSWCNGARGVASICLSDSFPAGNGLLFGPCREHTFNSEQMWTIKSYKSTVKFNALMLADRRERRLVKALALSIAEKVRRAIGRRIICSNWLIFNEMRHPKYTDSRLKHPQRWKIAAIIELKGFSTVRWLLWKLFRFISDSSEFNYHKLYWWIWYPFTVLFYLIFIMRNKVA